MACAEMMTVSPFRTPTWRCCPVDMRASTEARLALRARHHHHRFGGQQPPGFFDLDQQIFGQVEIAELLRDA